MLKNILDTTWNIFNGLSSQKIYDIITNLCKEKFKENPELFNCPVFLEELHNTDYIKEYSLLRSGEWEDFVRAIKYDNRFHNKDLNLELLKKFCAVIEKKYRNDDFFYRARISPTAQGFDPKDMGAPPKELVTAGRVNSMGVSCLYLANNIETPIHEVRAGAHDYVTVGTFKLKKEHKSITVVDLKDINNISPFIDMLTPLEHAMNKEHLKRINEELGKPLRRTDSELDYIPTQYISDFIKSIEDDKTGLPKYAGLEYTSTLNSKGYNVAIFNPDLFECVAVDTYKISALNYHKDKA